MADAPTITVVRPSEISGMLRSYRISIDGAEIGRIKPRGTVTATVKPGVHTVKARIGLVSNHIEVTVTGGRPVIVECSGEPHPLAVWLYVLRIRRGWLRLRVLPA
jgi:hypothetical protein